MDEIVVVGYDGTMASAAAVWRAQQLAPELAVVTSAGPPPSDALTWNVPVILHETAAVTVEAIYAVADAHGSGTVVLGDSIAPAPMLLRRAVAAATDVCRQPRPFSCLLVVRPHDVTGDAAYERILAGADGSVGSGIAALVAAWLARATEATLNIAAVERRKTLERRRLYDLRTATPGFDPAAFRTEPAPANPRLDLARRHIRDSGVDAKFEHLVGDPSGRLLVAAARGGYDLIVSGLLAAQPGSSHQVDKSLRMTRDLLRGVHTDHLLVFDAVSLGVASRRRATAALAGAATALLGVGG